MDNKNINNLEDKLDLLLKGKSIEDIFNSDNTKDNKTVKKEFNLWNSKDIKKVDIDVSSFKKTKKTFAIVAYNGKDALPDNYKILLDKISAYLFSKDYVLRTNGDNKSIYKIDYTKIPDNKLEIYLPWKSFNTELANKAVMTYANEIGYGIALSTRPKFLEQPNTVRALIANNVHIMLGKNCTEPLDLLLVYNMDGSEVVPEKKANYEAMGYTAYYMKLAEYANIPVFNIKKSDVLDRIINLLKSKETTQ